MTLQDLLLQSGLTSAIIVDDAYDPLPRASDIRNDAWATFFDDIGDDKSKIEAAFPEFAVTDAVDLPTSDSFVGQLWTIRESLRKELWQPLFAEYEQGRGDDLRLLSALEGRLAALGIKVVKLGRSDALPSGDCKLMFVDLFLGAPQEDGDMERSVSKVKELLGGKGADPATVVLMSRSPLLGAKKAVFRDRGGLVGALFRVCGKKDLLEPDALERVLDRLVRHRADGLRVARFLRAWENGLTAAATRFMASMRRLDLSDYAQVRQLLLEYEGQPIGAYVLDVFDRVLHHEVEGDADTITAAEDLNRIDALQYPAPHIAGTPDLQELVYRTTFQNPKRLDVKTSDRDVPVSFGDILVKVMAGDTGSTNQVGGEVDCLVVLTPPCDLVRSDGRNKVLLMNGSMNAVDSDSWTHGGADTLITPIVIMADGRRFQVRWKPKDLETWSVSDLADALRTRKTYRVTHRLRETYALELQQRTLADLGRVGNLARMPGTFAVRVKTFIVNTEGSLKRLAVGALEKDGAYCLVGRDKEGKVVRRLVVGPATDDLLTAVSEIDKAVVHEDARAAFERLKGGLTGFLDAGIPLLGVSEKSWKKLRVKKAAGAPDQNEELVALIALDSDNLPELTGLLKFAGMAFVVDIRTYVETVRE